MKHIECDICTYEWNAPIVDTDLRIKCPNCDNMVLFTVINQETI